VKSPFTESNTGYLTNHPFGMGMPTRSFEAGVGYKYGFNGKESDGETYGNGNVYDYGFRIYNPRLGKFLSVDPLFKSYPWNSTYSFSENQPIWAVDLDGLEKYIIIHRITYSSDSWVSRVESDVVIKLTNAGSLGEGTLHIYLNIENVDETLTKYSYFSEYKERTTLNGERVETIQAQGEGSFDVISEPNNNENSIDWWDPIFAIFIADYEKDGGSQKYGIHYVTADGGPSPTKQDAEIIGRQEDLSRFFDYLAIRDALDFSHNVLTGGTPELTDYMGIGSEVIESTVSSSESSETKTKGDTICCELGNQHIIGDDLFLEPGSGGRDAIIYHEE